MMYSYTYLENKWDKGFEKFIKDNNPNNIKGDTHLLNVTLPIPFSFSRNAPSLSLPYLLFHLTNPLKISFTINPSVSSAIYSFIINYSCFTFNI